jgi:hypothetical protein
MRTGLMRKMTAGEVQGWGCGVGVRVRKRGGLGGRGGGGNVGPLCPTPLHRTSSLPVLTHVFQHDGLTVGLAVLRHNGLHLFAALCSE